MNDIKKDFPIFTHHPELIYLDSTATSLKPQCVIDKMTEYYSQYSSNIHRGIYKIAEKASFEYEETREVVAEFIGASKKEEIIFTRGTTESMNLIAYTWGEEHIHEGDEIIVTRLEHHANFVPWQQLAMRKNATVRIIELDDDFGIKEITVSEKTKMVALPYVSNVTGTILPLQEIINHIRTQNKNITIVIDAAQAVPHMSVDVSKLNCDFLAFSGHKMMGPTGIGVLWGRQEVLNAIKPFNYGGDMIEAVYDEKTIFKEAPVRFEAGTPHIAGVIGLKSAIQYLKQIGLNTIQTHERMIAAYAMKSLSDAFGKNIKIYGPKNPHHRGAILSFILNDYHAHDVAQILDEDDICVRAGNHCAMPLHTSLGISATTRASFYIYNEKADVDKLVEGLLKVEKLLK